MKYLIVEDFAGQPVPFLFPNRVTHADMREQLPYSKVLSAGYVSLVNGRFICEGGDADVGAAANEADAAVIASFFAPMAAGAPEGACLA
ncbi:hypothetical protein LJC23_03075 [Desulfovibrio sp. OttesenSCG-928-I05]|nr:hypothetical protein [Desulfovibrio sp. OttesenSCG-928-I05]